MIPQEADQTHIEYGFPVVNLDEDLPGCSASGSASTPGVSAESNQRTASAPAKQGKFSIILSLPMS